MTAPRLDKFLAGLALVAVIVMGCSRKEEHEHEAHHDQHEGHHHEEESPSGASFKPGKGVSVTEETKGLLGIAIADVTHQPLPNLVQLTLQIFDEKHHHVLNAQDHAGCAVHGSGFVSTEAAAQLRTGQPVALHKGSNAPMNGIVLSIQKALALDESEIVIGISNATENLRPGEFVSARIPMPREGSVLAIPHSAVLRTAEGSFVYTVNGDAYFRTAIKAGSEIDGWVEIIDGLLEGDQVVIHPPQSLWLIELRATKGGGHSH